MPTRFIANILGDIDAMSEEAINKFGCLLAVGLSDNLTVEEELMTNEEIHQSLTLSLEVVLYRVSAGGGHARDDLSLRPVVIAVLQRDLRVALRVNVKEEDIANELQ